MSETCGPSKEKLAALGDTLSLSLCLAVSLCISLSRSLLLSLCMHVYIYIYVDVYLYTFAYLPLGYCADGTRPMILRTRLLYRALLHKLLHMGLKEAMP